MHISCTLYKKAMNSLHRLHSVYFAAQKRNFYAKSTRVSSRRSSASICRMASRIILPVIFVATGVLFSGGSCGFAPATSCRVEVGFDLLGQLQPGLVLRVGVGVHQDGGSCMAGVALHRLEVTARLQQLVGGTGVAQTVEHDLLKLRVLCSPHTIPLGQNVRGNG